MMIVNLTLVNNGQSAANLIKKGDDNKKSSTTSHYDVGLKRVRNVDHLSQSILIW